MVETHIPALAEDQSPQIQSLLRYPPSTPHLNAFGLVIKDSPTGSGRGIYATQCIASETVVEISPVLLFPPAEYRDYGSKTQLDGYTFIWKRTGKDTAIMALALGLGSLFNHSARPNVKWTLDDKTHSIRYETVRRVDEGEELVISYGSGRMWWEPEMTEEEKVREEEERRRREDIDEEALQMGRIGLDDEDDEGKPESSKRGVVNGIEVKQKAGPSKSTRAFPPIYRLTAAIDPVTLPLTTREAWIIDIPPTSASLAVKFLHQHSAILQNRDDGLHSTRHLRSFRTTADAETKKPRTQFLLCLRTAQPDRTQLVEWLTRTADGIFGSEPNPYLAPVPVIAAPTKQRLPEWQAVWPCIVRTNPKELVPGGSGANNSGPVLLVDREKDAAMWTQDEGRLRWALNRFKRVVALARYAVAESGDGKGEGRLKAIASAVHVTHPYDVARRFRATEGGLEWSEREQCDWSELIGPTAPLIGRIQPRSTISPTTEEHFDLQKQSLLSTLHMSVDEWTRFNTTTSPLYASSSLPSSGTIELDSLDRRLPLRNPLKHAVIDAVSRVSVLRTLDRSLPTSSTTSSNNGSDYLLTSLTLFTLYEPCVYCTMALVHSRVAEVYFLLPSPGRGGCCGSQLPQPNRCDDAGQDGGVYALQEQKGLNHSFAVWRWMSDRLEMPEQSDGLLVDDLAREFDIGLLDP
ncbi:SET domain-containing protein [Pseudozyma hubeiensis]|nr:SET domain-containing protein [Pseudozyma hubeiensis]